MKLSSGRAPTPAGTSVFTKHNWDMGIGICDEVILKMKYRKYFNNSFCFNKVAQGRRQVGASGY